MVNRIFTLALVLLFSGMSFASESSVLAFRAQKSIAKGKFAKGYGQLERALLASRKEADLAAEGRVLNSMAKIRIMSLDLDFADSLLSVVRQEVMDENTKQIDKSSSELIDISAKVSETISQIGAQIDQFEV